MNTRGNVFFMLPQSRSLFRLPRRMFINSVWNLSLELLLRHKVKSAVKSLSTAADLHYSRLSAECVLCLFSTQPLQCCLSANAYCLIIAMCVRAFAPCASVVHQAISIKHSAPEHRSVSGHLCPLAVSAHLPPAACVWNINQKPCIIKGVDEGRLRAEDRIQSNSLVNCDPVWSAGRRPVFYIRELLTCCDDATCSVQPSSWLTG